MVLKKAIKKIPPFRGISRQRKLTTGYGLLIINFIFQRIFRINGKCRYQVNYTSHVGFSENIRLEGEEPKMSLARSPGCYLQAKNGIEVGEGTIWGPGVKFISANHTKVDGCKFSKLEKRSPIKIGKGCWIGAGAILLPGVELGENTVVGAGAVVTKSFPEGSIVLVGVPARPLEKEK